MEKVEVCQTQHEGRETYHAVDAALIPKPTSTNTCLTIPKPLPVASVPSAAIASHFAI
ncbi:hypothetical protein PCI56_20420 [Plesiomonas shigelloides subsp. oncorhynchi]|nr:hypothetical protein [Plesiomonas shigelloides]